MNDDGVLVGIDLMQVFRHGTHFLRSLGVLFSEIPVQRQVMTEAAIDAGGFPATLFGANAEAVLKDIEGVQILACGTSYYAGMTARYWLEAIAGVPCDVEIASEYRYRSSVPNPRSLVVTISQSGETADTLAALRYAKAQGQHIVSVVNVTGLPPQDGSSSAMATRSSIRSAVTPISESLRGMAKLSLKSCTKLRNPS